MAEVVRARGRHRSGTLPNLIDTSVFRYNSAVVRAARVKLRTSNEVVVGGKPKKKARGTSAHVPLAEVITILEASGFYGPMASARGRGALYPLLLGDCGELVEWPSTAAMMRTLFQYGMRVPAVRSAVGLIQGGAVSFSLDKLQTLVDGTKKHVLYGRLRPPADPLFQDIETFNQFRTLLVTTPEAAAVEAKILSAYHVVSTAIQLAEHRNGARFTVPVLQGSEAMEPYMLTGPDGTGDGFIQLVQSTIEIARTGDQNIPPPHRMAPNINVPFIVPDDPVTTNATFLAHTVLTSFSSYVLTHGCLDIDMEPVRAVVRTLVRRSIMPTKGAAKEEEEGAGPASVVIYTRTTAGVARMKGLVSRVVRAIDAEKEDAVAGAGTGAGAGAGSEEAGVGLDTEIFVGMCGAGGRCRTDNVFVNAVFDGPETDVPDLQGNVSPGRRHVIVVTDVHEFSLGVLVRLLLSVEARYAALQKSVVSEAPRGAVRRSQFAKPVLIFVGNPRVSGPDGIYLMRSLSGPRRVIPGTDGVCPAFRRIDSADPEWWMTEERRVIDESTPASLTPVPCLLSFHRTLRDLSTEFRENPRNLPILFGGLRRTLSCNAFPPVCIDPMSFCNKVAPTDVVLMLRTVVPPGELVATSAPAPILTLLEEDDDADADADADDDADGPLPFSCTMPLASPENQASCAIYVYDALSRASNLLAPPPPGLPPTTVIVAFSPESMRLMVHLSDQAADCVVKDRDLLNSPDHCMRVGSIVMQPANRAIGVVTNIEEKRIAVDSALCGQGSIRSAATAVVTKPQNVGSEIATDLTIPCGKCIDRTVTPPEDAAAVANALSAPVTGVQPSEVVIAVYVPMADVMSGVATHSRFLGIIEGLRRPAVIAILTNTLNVLPHILTERRRPTGVMPAPNILDVALAAASETAVRQDAERTKWRLAREEAKAKRREEKERKKKKKKKKRRGDGSVTPPPSPSSPY